MQIDPAILEKEFAPKYPTSLPDQVVEYLTNAIIEGRYKSGERLVEATLQRKFGISRGPIREAFLTLKENGLITNIPRKGRFVRRINTKDLEENFVIRAHLESLAARLAADRLTQEDINKMESSLSGMKQAAKEKDFQTYYKFHFEFHGAFIHACKNDTLIRILENLRYQTIWFRYSNPSANERPYEYLLPVHREILTLFIKKDIHELEKLVKNHILSSLEGMLRLLASRSKETQV
jgi:DNA-binding GntR family transcriptional regulator